MRDEDFLRRLRDAVSPSAGSKDRVRKMIMARMRAPEVLKDLNTQLNPTDAQKESLWSRVQQSVTPPVSAGMLDRLKTFFSPAADSRLLVRDRVMARLSPQRHPAFGHMGLKWVSAFVVIALVVQIGPPLLIAPSTAAESSVLLVPTLGTSSVLLHGFWQPVMEEVTLVDGARLRTEKGGQMTVILHDDGNVRLGEGTVLALHDVSDRPEPALNASTLTIEQGKVWVQGLLPQHLRGITIATPHGDIVVHGGSVSVEIGDMADVRVWDGHVTIVRGTDTLALVAGERVDLWNENVPSVRRIGDADYADAWVKQNLSKDATHRREVAQWQKERRAAQAGILPNSPLYPVKRVAEQVDMLLTFNEEDYVEKKLAQASTRLSEAAALIAQGDSGATVPLEEYKAALHEIAMGGSGSTSVAQFLLRQEIAENTAELAAATPDDDLYALKKAVLEAGASLPEEVAAVDEQDVQGTLLVDTLTVVQDAVNSGDIDRAKAAFADVQPYLDSLQGNGDELKPEVRKEALALLSTVAAALGEGEQEVGSGSMQKDLLQDVVTYVPKVKSPKTPPLTEAQVQSMVQNMFDRIFVYKQPRARWNQLQYEMQQIQGHPDRGTILRHLYHALPEDGLARYVRTEIQGLRTEMENL